MDLIIDVNIVISAIISMSGKTRDLIFLSNLNLFAPEFLLSEFEKHKQEIFEKSKLSEDEFELALSIISSRIKFIPFSEFKEFISKAEEISPDPKDTEYFALALKLNCPIWSNDKELKKQKIIKTYLTEEIINF